MIPFLTYLLLAIAIGTVVERVQFRTLTDYNKKHNREQSVIPGVVVGAFWPVAVPAYGVFLLTKKVLDKYLKV